MVPGRRAPRKKVRSSVWRRGAVGPEKLRERKPEKKRTRARGEKGREREAKGERENKARGVVDSGRAARPETAARKPDLRRAEPDCSER